MSTPQMFDLSQTVCVNPATGEIVGYSRMNTPEEAREAIRRARAAQPAWAALPLAERERYLARIRDYLVDNADAVSETIAKDVGKTRVEALATEVLTSALATDYYLKNARLVGEQLRYVVTDARGQWLALIGWSAAALHLQTRDQSLEWTVAQRQARLHWLAQNSR